MIKYKRKGAYSDRKMFVLDNGSIYVIGVVDKKSQRRYKKFLRNYYGTR